MDQNTGVVVSITGIAPDVTAPFDHEHALVELTGQAFREDAPR